MNEKAEYIGWLSKIHGVNGHLILRVEDTSEKNIKQGDFVFLKINGLLVPFSISDFIQKDDTSYIIQFVDFEDKIMAEELKNCEVFTTIHKEKHTKSSTKPEFDISGFIVIDKYSGEIGIVDEVVEISQNPLIKVLKDQNEIFIPFNNQIVQDINESLKTVNVLLPEGLIELFS
ncbi:MAG: hypothetical protein JXB49_36130 [Bacteroidales bacterium]|nr:hypothetical protein [Bacteroidales bacterium]